MIRKYWKIYLIAAGVIASAAFYVRTPEGESLFTAESGERLSLLLPEEEGEEVLLETVLEGETGSARESGEGFSEKEKEELAEIVRQVLSEELEKKLQSALSEEFSELSESGRFSEALSEYEKVQSELIHLNTADQKALEELPGIGEAKSAAILSYREEHGGFESVEELLNVDGISEKLLEKIRDLVTL